MRVQVYKNLRTGLWSVCEPKGANTRGKVIAHERELTLTDCRFVVREAQRQWVLRKQERAVHAWVEGEWSPRSGEESSSAGDFGRQEFSYNPYKADHFYAGAANARVESAARVYFSSDGRAYFSN